MKKFIWSVIIGIAVIVFFIFLGKNSSDKIDTTENFCINIDKIDKILISQASDEVVLNEDNSLGWMVSGFLPADKDKIGQLLDVLRNMKIKTKVPDNVLVQVREDLLGSLKVQLMSGNKVYKSFYLGAALPDTSGNYMMESGDLIPYIVHLPGKKVDLRTFFPVSRDYWIDRNFMNGLLRFTRELKVSDDSTLKCHYVNNDSAFVLAVNTKDNVCSLFRISGLKKITCKAFISDPVTLDSVARLVSDGKFDYNINLSTYNGEYNIYLLPYRSDTSLYYCLLYWDDEKLLMLTKRQDWFDTAAR